jgi:hypothetical protein
VVGVNHQVLDVKPPTTRRNSVPPRTYEITFTGQADRSLCAQFDDCKVSTSPDATTLRAEVADHAALSGLVQRIAGLGLEITQLRLLA